jgi:hypothetical protein
MTTLSEILAEKDALMHKIALAKCDDATAFGDVTSADFRGTIERAGAAIQKAGESPEQARVRFLKTDAGRSVLQASRQSAGPDHRAAEPPESMGSDPARRGPASKEIHDKAQTLLLNEAGSRSAAGIDPMTRAGLLASAKTRIRRAHPDLAAAESREQRGA